MIAYLKRCFIAARSKVTTYVVAFSGVLTVTPDTINYFVHDQWTQLEAEIPRLHAYRPTVVVIGVLATMWARVRRDVRQ